MHTDDIVLIAAMIMHLTVLSTILGVGWSWDLKKGGGGDVATGSITDYCLECFEGMDFEARAFYFLAEPFALTAAIFAAASVVSMCKRAHAFGGFRRTIRAFGLLAVYIFLPDKITNLVMVLPCFDAAEGRKMVRSFNSGLCFNTIPCNAGLRPSLRVYVAQTVAGDRALNHRHRHTDSPGCFGHWLQLVALPTCSLSLRHAGADRLAHRSSPSRKVFTRLTRMC